ncbi:MAG: deoxyribodipyrimidine photo-lyase [Filomicrobium sp.]
MRRNRSKSRVQIVWFKRDLRIVDNHPLCLALEQGLVLPLLVIEPEFWKQPDVSARHYDFYRECVEELACDLERLGQPLIVRVGDVIVCLNDLHGEVEIGGLWSHEETGNAWTFQRDIAVAAWCRQHGVAWAEIRQDGAVRKLKNRDGWAERWDKKMAAEVRPAPSALPALPKTTTTHALPTAEALGLMRDHAPLRQLGGRVRARTTLSSFLNERGEPYRAAMSSPIAGEQACSRLSPYLAWGCLSMREVAQATWHRQRELKQIGGKSVSGWRSSLVSFNGRLHWHCHFMQKLEDEPRLEFENLHPAYDALRAPSQSDAARLAAWEKGETGLPFVDACMRYLAATGWLNFRMRAMLMATASYHLWLHWRAPGLHLARQFVDYEPGIHWPQVQMQSGTTGINTVRIYNPIKQGHDQDPGGSFVRRWVPELASIEGSAIHEPWKSAEAGRLLDKTYPMPIVDHMEAAREARQKIYGARKGDEFRDAANAIQEKHGSRKSGLARSGNRASRRTKKSQTGAQQVEMEFGSEKRRSGKRDA